MARTGPGDMPRLQGMMLWYATQAENLRQTDFIDGQLEPDGAADDGPPPLPKGPYEVNFQSVDEYLGALKKSGFFSARYLATLRARSQATQRALEHAQPPSNTMPSIEDVPLFARNYDDMMDQKNSFRFSVDQGGKVVTLNDGDNIQRFTFDAVGKIDSVKSVPIDDSL